MRTRGIYARDTDVTPERSKAEIEATVQRYGATGFASAWQGDRAFIAFEIEGRRVRFVVDPPDRSETSRNAAGAKLGATQADQAYQKELRRRWRALALVIKAKLEVVDSGLVDLEAEFLAHLVLPDNSTVGEWIGPQIEAAYNAGRMPELLPGAPIALTAGGE